LFRQNANGRGKLTEKKEKINERVPQQEKPQIVYATSQGQK